MCIFDIYAVYFEIPAILVKKILVMMKLSCKNVSRYLFDIGICNEQDLESIRIDSNSSNSLIISLHRELQLIFKQERYYHNLNNNKIENEFKLYQFWQSSPDLVYQSLFNLEILHFDKQNSILIYQSSKKYINLESYFTKQKNLPIEIARLLGRALAFLHRQTMNSQVYHCFIDKSAEDKLSYQFPYPVYLQERLDPETFFMLPPESYKFIHFYQRCENLIASVKELVFNHVRCCLTHNNLQFNNVLVFQDWTTNSSLENLNESNLVKLINWENCSWGEPASDIGMAISGYLLLWLNSLVIHPEIKLNISLEIAIRPLEMIRPSIVNLLKSYLFFFPEVIEYNPKFMKRVVQFIGIGLLYSTIEKIQSFKGFDYRSLCVLQIAKSLVCTPEKSFESIFGITESEVIES